MAKRRRKLSFLKAREKALPTDFARDYVIAVRALSKKHKTDPETIKAVKLLKRMSREASLAGRGEVWMPRPGSTTGHYPVIGELPFSKIRTALRKNTLKRQRAWDAVAAATRPFYPQHSAVSRIERSLLPAAMIALPFVRGRTPALLGKRVPGELQMTRSGSSIIPIRGISPDEWEQHGFQPLTFETVLTRVAAKRRRIPRLSLKGKVLAAFVAKRLAVGGLAAGTVASWGHTRKMQERVGLKKPLSTGGHALRATFLGPGYHTGRGAAENKKRPSRKWVRKAARQGKLLEAKGYELLLEPVEELVYEKGFQYGLRAFLRRHHVGARLKRGALPAALGGLVLEGLRRAHTEFGIPPTTVDLIPVLRTSLKGEFAQFTNMQLAGFRTALSNKIAEADPETVNEIKKQIGKINVEIIGRRAI